jgi:hypothetical protein
MQYVTTRLRAYIWSTASLALISGLLLFHQFIAHHFEARPGTFEHWQHAGAYEAMLGWGAMAAAAASIVGLVKEPRPWSSLVALVVAGFLLFAWAYSA